MSIAGKSIIVTGASSGIGAATAITAAAAGAKVMLADRDVRGGNKILDHILDEGGEADFQATDIGVESEIEALVDATVARFGGLDGAFNNAGISGYGHQPGHCFTPFANLSSADFMLSMKVNALGTFLCMKYEIQAMLANGGGAIVNNSSNAGWLAIAGAADYMASKHAVIGLTKSAALDYARHNIRVNAVLPGTIRTQMVADSFDNNPELNDWAMTVQPTGQLGQPVDVGEAVIWLLSDKATFVTGISMPVDGGYSMV